MMAFHKTNIAVGKFPRRSCENISCRVGPGDPIIRGQKIGRGRQKIWEGRHRHCHLGRGGPGPHRHLENRVLSQRDKEVRRFSPAEEAEGLTSDL